MNQARPGLGKTCRALALAAVLAARILQAAQEPPPGVVQSISSKEVAEPVGLADWPALARALKQDKAAQGRIVSFRELWLAKPGELTEPIAISGVVLRRFRREAIGQFPPLEELWLRTDDDNLLLVTNRSALKASKTADVTTPGSAVDIVATYLRKVRYEAADESRIAPWLVASSIVTAGSPAEHHPGSVPSAGSEGNSELLLVLLAVITASALLRVVLFYAKRNSSGRRVRSG